MSSIPSPYTRVELMLNLFSLLSSDPSLVLTNTNADWQLGYFHHLQGLKQFSRRRSLERLQWCTLIPQAFPCYQGFPWAQLKFLGIHVIPGIAYHTTAWPRILVITPVLPVATRATHVTTVTPTHSPSHYQQSLQAWSQQTVKHWWKVWISDLFSHEQNSAATDKYVWRGSLC